MKQTPSLNENYIGGQTEAECFGGVSPPSPKGRAEREHKRKRREQKLKYTHNSVKMLLCVLILSSMSSSLFTSSAFAQTPTSFTSEAAIDGYVCKWGRPYPPQEHTDVNTGYGSLLVGQWREIDTTEPGYIYGIERSYVSFDTSSLPDTAYIVSAKLKLKTKRFYSQENFIINVRGGQQPIYGGSLEAADWDCGTVTVSTWNTANYPGDDLYIELSIPGEQVNVGGRTQFELKSNREGTSPTGDQDMTFYSGNSPGNEPKLEVVYTTATGKVTGTVTASNTGTQISGAMVSIGAISDTTGADGVYTLYVLQGSQTITATATGYYDYSNTVEVIAGATVTHDIAMTPIPDDWTFMVYLDADNYLESNGIDDFGEMAAVGSTDEVNIVVQMDRISGDPDWDDTSYGDWTDCRRFYITYGLTPGADPLQNLGEVNMGDPNVLIDFVEWAVDQYPANNYALVLWDYGEGCLEGVCFDDSSSSDYITLPELGQAMTTIKGYLGRNIDILGFDACIMQMIEVAYEIRNTTNIVVGSEEREPPDGWPYDDILTDLTATPSVTPAALASNIVSLYVDSYQGGSQGTISFITQSAFYENNIVTNLVPAVSSFADRLIENLPNYATQINLAIQNTQDYICPYEYLDLYDFADQIYWRVPVSNVQIAAQNVMNALVAARIAEGHDIWCQQSHGLTIYLTDYSTDPISSYGNLDFALDTSWDEFLQALGTQLLIIQAGYGGTTSPSPDTYEYIFREQESVSAIATVTNYKFYYWLLDNIDVGNQNPYTVTMDSDHTLKAVFQYTGPTGCVAEGTLVTMADGSTKPVEEIKKGDQVLGFDPTTGSYMAENVLDVTKTKVEVMVYLNNGMLKLTPTDQPIFIRNSTYEGWVRDPATIEVGWEIYNAKSGSWVSVTSITIEEGKTRVYDLVLDGYTTYIANGILLMDKC